MKLYTKNELNNFFQALTYDDISLVPAVISTIKSRTEANTRAVFMGIELAVPVVSSPMDTVTGIEMAKALTESGCLGVLNRFDSSLETVISGKNGGNGVLGAAIGLNTEDDVTARLAEAGMVICIDTANANNREVLQKCEHIKKKFNPKVMVGNTAHGATLRQLKDAGADSVRVGIGNGSVCSTSIQTGIGIGQVTSLLDVLTTREEQKIDIEIIADGGIKSPGDVAKAIALGADVIMLGRMLAGTRETPGEVIKYNGQLWKKYRGSASFGVKMRNEFIEGEETMVAYKGTVRNVINSISDGLKSSMSYMNCYTLDDLRKTETFAVLSNSSYLERLPKA